MNIKVVLVCILTTVLVYFVGTRTLVNTVQAQNNKKAELKRDIAATETAVSNLNKIKLDLDQNKADVELINTALPSDEGIPELLVMLESLYQTKGFKVTSISLGTSGTNTAEIPTSIAGTSNFEELFNIFNAIQTNIRPAVVKNFSANGTTDDASGSTTISSSFSLSFPFTNNSSDSTNSSGGQQ